VSHDADLDTRAPVTVRIGGLDAPSLLHSLNRFGARLNRAASILFQHPHFTTLERPHVVDIAYRSVAALGFSEGATYRQIVGRALEAGLTECPLELGPHLRMQFPDQLEVPATATSGRAPPGSITIASCPLDDAEPTPKGFYLRSLGGVSWLRGYWSPHDHVWAATDVLVFSRAIVAI